MHSEDVSARPNDRSRRRGLRGLLPTGARPASALPAGLATFAAAGILAGTLTAVLAGRPAAVPADGPGTRPPAGSDTLLPGLGSGAVLAEAARPMAGQSSVAPLRRTVQADLLVVSPSSLPAAFASAVSRLPGVTTAERVEAVRMRVNGSYTPVLGVDPSVFRSFAARPTAASNALWQGVANGGVAVSYTMGKLDKLPLGGTVTAAGRTTQRLRVTAFGTLGIGGVSAVVSDAVARSLGAPAGNALVISTPAQDLGSVTSALGRMTPRGASVEPLLRQASGSAGSGSATGGSASSSALDVMLRAAISRLGLPYVWGAAGPAQFDCSGLVQWAFARAGITMPRVAADQALAGPSVPVSRLRPGDLLFYHTDPTDPTYISHVAIYLGDGRMIQAPEPGENVEVVPAAFGPEFAGAIRVNPAQAAALAARLA